MNPILLSFLCGFVFIIGAGLAIFLAQVMARTATFRAVWDGGVPWAYTVEFPHSTFEIKEDGEVYCRGFVFALADAIKPTAAMVPAYEIQEACAEIIELYYNHPYRNPTMLDLFPNSRAKRVMDEAVAKVSK